MLTQLKNRQSSLSSITKERRAAAAPTNRSRSQVITTAKK
nr:MAG TPA: hypothetical protein [Caudoviricetes sp.]